LCVWIEIKCIWFHVKKNYFESIINFDKFLHVWFHVGKEIQNWFWLNNFEYFLHWIQTFVLSFTHNFDFIMKIFKYKSHYFKINFINVHLYMHKILEVLKFKYFQNLIFGLQSCIPPPTHRFIFISHYQSLKKWRW